MIKRSVDSIGSLLFCIVLFPLLLVCIVISAIDTNSSGLFLQTRIGQFGKPFTIFKLRTIHISKESISSWGKFIRNYKLDELPQLINVLIGDMSFVGFRPDVPGYYDVLVGENRKIVDLKPGLTSEAAIKYFDEEAILATKSNPLEYNNTVIFPDKIRLNLDYYYHHSLWVDFKIIWKTIWVLFR